MIKRMYCLLMLIVPMGISSFAFDLTSADDLFARRENSLTNIASARSIYRQALSQGRGEERAYALDQLGKLAYYEGELLTDEENHDRRVQIFQECQDDVEKISPNLMGGREYPAYYYWKAACIALWAKSASSLSVLGRVGDLEKAMNRGAEIDPNFAGGGIYRVMGSVYLKSKSMRWIPGLSRFYNPKKALEHITKAIALGSEYYNAYLVKAEILKELGHSDEGLALLQTKKRELERRVHDNTLPEGLEAESKVVLRQISDVIEKW